MIIKEGLNFKSQKLEYRHLNIQDATDEYVSWFENEDTKKFILGASNFTNKEKLSEYINMHNNKEDSILIGVFRKGIHIGNIKYEPINFYAKTAWLGILIGRKENRSKGFGAEIIHATTKILRDQLGIRTIRLGVNVSNKVAMKSYEKIGFRKIKTNDKSNTMELEI